MRGRTGEEGEGGDESARGNISSKNVNHKWANEAVK